MFGVQAPKAESWGNVPLRQSMLVNAWAEIHQVLPSQLSRIALFDNWTFKITKWISTLNIIFSQEQLLHDILFSSQQQQQRPKVYEQARTNQFVPIPEQQKPKNWWLFPPPNINIQSGSGSRQVATQERLWPLSFYEFSTQCWLPKEKLVSDFTFFEHLYLC